MDDSHAERVTEATTPPAIAAAMHLSEAQTQIEKGGTVHRILTNSQLINYLFAGNGAIEKLASSIEVY